MHNKVLRIKKKEIQNFFLQMLLCTLDIVCSCDLLKFNLHLIIYEWVI